MFKPERSRRGAGAVSAYSTKAKRLRGYVHTGCPPLAMGSDNVNQALECPKSRSSRQHRADLLALGPHPDSRVCAVVAEVIQHFIETCIQKGGEGAPLRDPQANGEGWDMALATRAWLAALALSLSMAVLCCHRVASRCRHLSIPLPAVLENLPRLCCDTHQHTVHCAGLCCFSAESLCCNPARTL